MWRGWRAEPLLALLAGAAGVALVAAMTPAGVPGLLRALATVYTRPDLLESAILYSAPITASAIGLAAAYRARFLTIGSEGQVLAGALAAMWILCYAGLQGPLALPAAAALAALAGTLLGLVVGVLRAVLGVNETLSSLMLNYIVLAYANYLIAGPWRAGAFTETRSVPAQYTVPWQAVLAVLVSLAFIVEALTRWTRFGVAVEALGAAPRAAETYSIPSRRLYVYVSALQGATAGLGGALMLTGFQRVLTAMSVSPGYGYMGILVAWLALLSPAASLLAGYFFSTLIVAGYILQSSRVPFNTVLVIQSIIVLTVLAYVTLSRRRR